MVLKKVLSVVLLLITSLSFAQTEKADEPWPHRKDGNKVRKFLLTLFLVALASTSFADENDIPTREVVDEITRYANSKGCFIHMDDENIVRHQIRGKSYFIALYDIDTVCNMGNNNHRPAFAALSNDKHGSVVIVKKYSNPAQTSDDFPQTIERIFTKDGELWYAAKEYNWSMNETDPAKIDAICCPSLTVEARFYFGEKGWMDTRVQADGHLVMKKKKRARGQAQQDTGTASSGVPDAK